MKVAFLGLGAIGRPMAAHLTRPPFSLTVWNRTAERAAEFAREFGVSHAESPAEAARGAEVVITCLPTSLEVEALLDGASGLLAGMSSGGLLLDCTSGDPAASRRIAGLLQQHGVAFMDAPVSGGTTGAEKGTLTVMCGGDASVLARAEPVLKAFGERIVHCGDVGAGHAVKAVNNALLAVNIAAVSEGMRALTEAGVDMGLALSVINASSGRSNVTENLFPERVVTRAFPRTFRLALLEKDLGIAAGIAREQKVPSPMLQLASELWRMARHDLGEEADHVEYARWQDGREEGRGTRD